MRYRLPLLALFLAACNPSASAGQLPTVRLGYNEAIARSNNEQLLLNIVRLRYLHAPQFFEVASVTTQSAVRTSGAASITGNAGNNISNDSIFTPFVTGVIGGDISMEDRPTVQYSPLQGEDFAQRMVTPIRADTLLLMVEVGWRIDRLLTAAVQRINDLPAPVIASQSDEFGGADFREVAEHLYELQLHQALEVSVLGAGEDRRLVLAIVPPENDAELQMHATEVRRLLGLRDQPVYQVVGSRIAASMSAGGDQPAEAASPEEDAEAPGAEDAEPEEAGADDEPEAAAATAAEAVAAGPALTDRIVLRGRSLLGALFYLSHGVEVPRSSESTARSLDYRASGAEVRVPQPLPQALLRVRRTDGLPEDSFIATQYRGEWYSISDADLDSKSNLLLLNVLFSVLSSSNAGAPVLTIPVGG